MALTRINNQALTNVTSAGLPTLTNDKLPAGSIIQVKNSELTSQFSHTVSTKNVYQDTGLSVTLTPRDANSKMSIQWNIGQLANSDMDGGYSLMIRLVRVVGSTTTAINIGDQVGSYRARDTAHRWFGFASHLYSSGDAGGVFLDSPSTTSSITYKVQVSSGYTSGGNTIYINRNAWNGDSDVAGTSASNLVVMEVAG